MRFWCLVVTFVLCTPLVRGVEVVVGGEGVAEGTALLKPNDLASSDLGWELSFAPLLSARAASLELAAEVGLSCAEGKETPELTLRRLELRWDPLEALALRVGRFSYLPGAAEVSSPVNYFARTSLEALVGGREAILPADLLQLSLYWREAFLRLSASPSPLEPVLPSPLSPWFPRRDFPSSITVSFPKEQVLVLDKLEVEEGLAAPEGFAGVSACAEIGVSLPIVDLSALYYHGIDNAPLLGARLSFPHGLYQSYDIYLSTLWRTIDAVGLTAAAAYGAFRAWADGSVTFAKTYLTGGLDAATMKTAMVSAPTVEWSVGASAEPDFADLILLVEWKSRWTNLEESEYLAPFLGSLLAASARLGLWDGRVSLGLSSLTSTQDWSTALSLAASWTPQDELELAAGAPIMLGGVDTELGQFVQNHAVWLRLTWRV